jgi:tRNA threonylcarbamoyladenosine biosynthesis protein TsaE
MIVGLKDLPPLASSILQKVPPPARIHFFGEVGAGKTTLIRQICYALGVKQLVSSPSYTYINEYSTENLRIAHIDLYRGGVFDVDELTEHTHFDYIFVEWPKEDCSNCNLSIKIRQIDGNQREVLVFEK